MRYAMIRERCNRLRKAAEDTLLPARAKDVLACAFSRQRTHAHAADARAAMRTPPCARHYALLPVMRQARQRALCLLLFDIDACATRCFAYADMLLPHA